MSERVISTPASWRDEVSGVSDGAGFLACDQGAIMVHYHLPAERTGRGVVLCGPTDREQVRHYHRDALIGRSLAAAGVATVRLDYRGTGNSDTMDGPLSLQSIEEDVSMVATWFSAEHGLERVGFVAESLASLPVARAARAYPRAPTAFLEPVVRPSAYYRHLQRTRLVAEARGGAADWVQQRKLGAVLEEQGWADILGYRLDADSYRLAVARDLETDLGEDPRPVLVMQVDKRDSLRKELADLVQSLDASGFAVDSFLATTEHAWWYIPKWEPEIADEENLVLIPALTDWLARALELPVASRENR